MYHIMLPDAILALQQELKQHPELLAKLEGMDLESSLGAIAADLGILLDGVYDLPDLCNMLVGKLRQKGAIIVANDPQFVDVEVTEGPKAITIELAKSQSPKPEEK